MLLNNRLLSKGTHAPEFALLDNQGRSLRLADVQGNRGTVLLFVSSDWLPTDIRLLTAYRDAYLQLRDAGLGVAAISGINWEKLHYLAARLKLRFPVLFDPCCRIAKRYQAMWIPKFVNAQVIYGIDRQGVIVLAQKQVSPSEVLAAFSS